MWSWESEAKSLGADIARGGAINIGYEITDRICEKGFADKTAVIWRGRGGMEKHLSYGLLSVESSRFAAFLKRLGLASGDRVFIYTDKIPELYISVPGILKAGGVVGPLFSSFGAQALRERLDSAGAGIVIVQASLLGSLMGIRNSLRQLRHVIVAGYAADLPEKSPGLHLFREYEDFEPAEPVQTFPGDDAVMHYTSGTTGRPKGAVHTQSALIGHYATTRHILDLKPDDTYWCTADPAWVTGMSYGIFGPMSCAATQLSLEGGVTPKIMLEAIQRYKVTNLYTSPTLLRMLMREREEAVGAYDLSSLRFIASVGEALNPEIIRWSEKTLGLPVHDTWFQTETGCIMIANPPGPKVVPGAMGVPVPPVSAAVLDDSLEPLPRGAEGRLALRPGWPSMFRTYWNNGEIYESKFKNGWYLTGDSAKLDEDGYFRFVAREDDVINTAGHLVSPFEVESVLLEHPSVAESAVVGIPDRILGEKIKAFIVLKPDIDASGHLKVELRSMVRRLASPFAVPQEMEFTDSLPKTRTGKLVRRLLRAKELGMPAGDLSSLEEQENKPL